MYKIGTASWKGMHAYSLNVCMHTHSMSACILTQSLLINISIHNKHI